MRNYVLTIIGVLFFTSCQSNEEKAAELIKTELSKTLYDFESYEPIETIVTEAYNTANNDSTCLIHAMAIVYEMEKVASAINDAKEASEYMDIWGPPTYYSSSYSDNKYYKYKSEKEDKLREARTSFLLLQGMSKSLEDTIPNFDGKNVIGWEVKHKFRCKTRGGMPTIGDLRYILSSDFKNVLWQEDLDDESIKHVHEILDYATKGELSKTIDNNV